MEKIETEALVIGGGVNGTGIARDLSLRGIKVLLCEKKDFSSGSTGACSGMIHGGLRYLLNDMDTTRRSCLDSGYIQKIAPYMLFRIPFIAPVQKDDPRGKIYLELAEAYFSGYDRFQPLKRGKPHTRLTQRELLQLVPSLNKNVLGGVTMDEWGIDPFRLCVANAISAEENSAVVRNHTELVEFIIENGSVKSAILYDHIKKEKIEVKAKVFINAAGPWLTSVASLAGTQAKIRPGKGVHLILPARIINYGIITRAIDGRQVFIMPHDNSTIIGTTDDDYYGDPDDIPIVRDEVEYLLQAIEKILPDIKRYPMVRAMAGIRITLFKWGLYEDDLSREHKIYDPSKYGGPAGIFTIAGGKLASYRLMSEEMGDLISSFLKVDAKSSTHKIPLPGAEVETSPEELAEEFGSEPYWTLRLYRKYGCRAKKILEMIREEPQLGEKVCMCEPVSAAEIVYAIRNEHAKDLTDIRRRTRLGTGNCQGRRCALKASMILSETLGYKSDATEFYYHHFLKERWKGVKAIAQYGNLSNVFSMCF